MSSILTCQKVYLHSIYTDRPTAFSVGIAVLNSGAHFGGFLSLLLSVRIADAVGGDTGYRAGIWVAAAVGSVALASNLAVRAFERNYEYDAVQRRRHATGTAERHGGLTLTCCAGCSLSSLGVGLCVVHVYTRYWLSHTTVCLGWTG